MAGRLGGKVAIVTGASSGIGEAVALDLAAEGARVALAGRRADRLEALARRIGTLEARAVPTDVSDEAAVRRLVAETLKAFGRVDILVNNAGVMQLASVLASDTASWREMVGTNLLGMMYATHAVLPIMIEQGSGHIVNMSSTAGRVARPEAAAYAATKWGVCAFSEALRCEVAKSKIRVTVVEPGVTRTELLSKLANQQIRTGVQGWVDANHPLAPEDIARAIVFSVTEPWHVNVNELLIRSTDQDR